ncbi:ERF115 protein [Hibiscus syriacus]|uniref:ERF115 protein n=1 Tax=Hibiscus syriacus TaxID=106335 RepID=A0A6A2XVS6_HIBSY|nr:ERF115 protein [Hibiscus syriacus]
MPPLLLYSGRSLFESLMPDVSTVFPKTWSYKDKQSSYAPVKGLCYDRIYRVEKCWRSVGVQVFTNPNVLIFPIWFFYDHEFNDENFSLQGFKDVNGCWKWMKPPPMSKQQENTGGSDSRKMARAALWPDPPPSKNVMKCPAADCTSDLSDHLNSLQVNMELKNLITRQMREYEDSTANEPGEKEYLSGMKDDQEELEDEPEKASKQRRAAKILANLIVMGSGILGRALFQAYRQALANASKSGVAQETIQNIRRGNKIMAEPEADRF